MWQVRAGSGEHPGSATHTHTHTPGSGEHPSSALGGISASRVEYLNSHIVVCLYGSVSLYTHTHTHTHTHTDARSSCAHAQQVRVLTHKIRAHTYTTPTHAHTQTHTHTHTRIHIHTRTHSHTFGPLQRLPSRNAGGWPRLRAHARLREACRALPLLPRSRTSLRP